MNNLRKVINKGDVNKLRNMLLDNSFTETEIDNEVAYVKQKKLTAILDINNTISDETFDKMIDMLTNYKKSKLVGSKMQSDAHKYMQSYLLGGKKKSRKSNKKKTKKVKRKIRKTRKRQIKN